MNKKRWALIVFCLILLFAYVKLFYKTYNENVIAQSADYIIALDVKRITNTIIWNYITTPGQWTTGNVFSSSKKEIDWKSMVEIPDFIFAFHTKNQPANAWYTVLEIKSDEGFEKGLLRYHFEKLNSNEYVSEETGIYLFKNENKVLVANAGLRGSNYITMVTDELFTKKKYIEKQTLIKIINEKSHLALHIAANNFLMEEGIITANFDKNTVKIDGAFVPKIQYQFTEHNFNYTESSLCTLGFTQPEDAVYSLLSDSVKDNISKAASINLDSLLLKNNQWYGLDIAGIMPRTDSAVSYTYDDNFNKIEKVVVNYVQEPAFNFTIAGDSISTICNSWQRNGKLEKTVAGELFLPMPFVKAYCYKKNEQELNITSANYKLSPPDKMIKCIFYWNLLLTKIPVNLLKFLPESITKSLDNIALVTATAKKNGRQVLVHIDINKKANNLPLVNW